MKTLLVLSVAMFALACGRRNPEVRQMPEAPLPDQSYTDLQAPSVLKIVVPLFRSGRYRAEFEPRGTSGKTSTTDSSSSDNLLGYETVRYVVTGRRNGAVRLRWSGAQETRNDRTTVLNKQPALPFALPKRLQHIRLVYLVRASKADHNMAILASRDVNRLQSFTGRLKQDPAVCVPDHSVFCTFVSSGIAVRVE